MSDLKEARQNVSLQELLASIEENNGILKWDDIGEDYWQADYGSIIYKISVDEKGLFYSRKQDINGALFEERRFVSIEDAKWDCELDARNIIMDNLRAYHYIQGL